MTTVRVLLDKVDHVKNFVNTTARCEADIDLVVGRYIIDAKSIMGIFSVDLTKPVELQIHADGETADEILEQLREYIV